jgi:putative sigma-54 modulation protein
MRIDVRSKDLEVSELTREYVDHRLGFALRRFDGRITNVRVHLEDVNGPKGGIDKRCRIEVNGERSLQVIVNETQGDLHAAIDAAADRVGHQVARAIERVRERSA